MVKGNKKQVRETILKLLERGVKIAVADKFAEFEFTTERDISLRDTEFYAIGLSLGETLQEIKVPTQWRRFLKTKTCPKYLKEITTFYINAYYPQISLPHEKNWIAIDEGITRNYGEDCSS